MEYVTKQRQILGISLWPISKTTCKYNYSYHHHEFSLPSRWLLGKLYTCIFWFFSIKFSQQIFIGTNYLHLQTIISWYSNTMDFFFFFNNTVEFKNLVCKSNFLYWVLHFKIHGQSAKPKNSLYQDFWVTCNPNNGKPFTPILNLNTPTLYFLFFYVCVYLLICYKWT